MRVIVGLGNPGSAYQGTRHNVGFAVVEELAERWRLALGRTRGGVRMARGLVAGHDVTIVEPQMYMNVSGVALAQMKPAVTAKDLVVVHDDLDLECGSVRVKRGGGTAGHHGLDSIVECFEGDFTRVRVGIGRPAYGTTTEDHVLSRFDAEEFEIMSPALRRAADAVECVLREGENIAMNRFNVRPRGSSVIATPAPSGRS